MSLLQIIQDAAVLCGIEQPTSAIGSTELAEQQLVALAQIEGNELVRDHDWRELQKTLTITGDGNTTVWPYEADWKRLASGSVLWRETDTRLPLVGPITDAEWSAIRISVAGIWRRVWQLQAGGILVYPALDTGDVVKGLYYAKNWIQPTSGNPVARWTADTNVSLIDEDLITLGVIWRWKKAKGYDYAEEFRTYQIAKDKITGANKGERVLVSGVNVDYGELPQPMVPETIPVA